MRIVTGLARAVLRRFPCDRAMNVGVTRVTGRGDPRCACVGFVTAQARPVGLGRATVTDCRVTFDAALRAGRCGVGLVTLEAFVVSPHRRNALLWLFVTGGASLGVRLEDVRRVAGTATPLVGERGRIDVEAAVRG
jgi:hypothetical protein